MSKSLAVAYAMKKRPKAGKPKGVHEAYFEDSKGEGMSKAGEQVRGMDLGEDHKEKAMEEHHKVLGEMHAMPKPKLQGLAHGGRVAHPDFVNMLVKERGHQSDDEMESQAQKYDHMAGQASHHKSKSDHMNSASAFREAVKKRKTGFAEGGEVDGSDGEDLVARIMTKMSKGGQVANESEPEADFMPNEFDDLALRDDLESHYGDDDNSGDALGNAQEDDDRKDIVSRIMSSRRKKDRNPRPA